jgi:hypothetical protein
MEFVRLRAHKVRFIRMQARVSRALLTCAALVLLLGTAADDDLERIMPVVEVR